MGRSLTLASALVAASVLPLALPVAGCGGGASSPGPLLEFDACQPLALSPDPSLSDAQRAGITAGLALWNDAAHTQLSLGAVGAVDAAAMPSVPIHFQGAAPPFHGLYDGGQIFINEDLSGLPRSVVIAHEVGHAFGLVHISASERPSLMNPGNLMIEPTSSDIDTLAMRWGRCQ